MYLKNGNLVIRNATASDAQTLCSWWNDGNVMAHAGFPYGLNITEKDILDELVTDNDQNRRLILEANDVPIGEMNYRTAAENVAAIGIKICDFAQQEKGFGTKFLEMLLGCL